MQPAQCLRRAQRFVTRCFSTAPSLEAITAINVAFEELHLNVIEVPGRGRGLFAACRIPHGAVLANELPLACHAKPSLAKAVCQACLADLADLPGLAEGSAAAAAPQPLLCARCSASATTPDATATRRAAWADVARAVPQDALAALHEWARRNRQMLPLLALDHACATAARHSQVYPRATASAARADSSAPAGQADGCGTAFAHSAAEAPLITVGRDEPDCVRTLCFAKLPGPGTAMYENMVESYGLVHACLTTLARDDPAFAFLTQDWYFDLIARLHMNHFRCQRVLPLPVLGSDPALMMEPSCGVVTYAIGSFFNHSCEPNLDVQWRCGDATASYVALRDITEREELCVAYIDCSMSYDARRSALLEWGFECTCPMCTELA